MIRNGRMVVRRRVTRRSKNLQILDKARSIHRSTFYAARSQLSSQRQQQLLAVLLVLLSNSITWHIEKSRGSFTDRQTGKQTSSPTRSTSNHSFNYRSIIYDWPAHTAKRSSPRTHSLLVSAQIDFDTHTHTHIYIYIGPIWPERERGKVCVCVSLSVEPSTQIGHELAIVVSPSASHPQRRYSR